MRKKKRKRYSYDPSRLDKWDDAETWYDREDGFIDQLDEWCFMTAEEDTDTYQSKYSSIWDLTKLLYLLGVEPRG